MSRRAPYPYPYDMAPPVLLVGDEPRVLWRYFAFFVGLAFVLRFVPPVGMLVCLVAALYAMRGPRQTVEALTVLLLLLLMGNRAISIGRWLVLFAAFGRVLWDTVFGDAPLPKVLIPLLAFSLSVFVCSVLVSSMPAVSVFKVISFTIGAATLLVAFYRTMHLRAYWYSWVLTFTLAILIASVPMFVLGMGYGVNGTGFQGILSHPQTYGPVCAPFAALLTGRILYDGDRSRLVQLGALLAWSGMFMSQSRTAMLGAVISFVLAVGIGMFKGRTWREPLARVLVKPATIFLLFATLGLVVIQWGVVSGKATEFLLKDDGQSGTVSGALQDSRGGLVNRSMDNFRSAPLTGIGFGVPSDPADTRIVYGPMGIPLGASVEKGFMPSAVLEETGISGAILVVLLLIGLVAPIIYRGSFTLFWMLMACMTINLGEMVFFATGGGLGFFFWFTASFCHVAALAAPLERSRYPYARVDQRRFGPHGGRGDVPRERPPLAAPPGAGRPVHGLRPGGHAG